MRDQGSLNAYEQLRFIGNVTPREVEALRGYARDAITKYSILAFAQLRAKANGVKRSDRMAMVAPFTLPNEIDPYLERDEGSGYQKRPLPHDPRYFPWDPQRPLLVPQSDRVQDLICSNAPLFDFINLALPPELRTGSHDQM